MDVWIIYAKDMYEKKKEKGTLNTLISYAKERKNLDLSIFPDHLFSIFCDGKNNKIFYDKKEIKIFPKIIFFKKYDLYLARQFELLGIKVLNSTESMNTSRNKLKTYQILTGNNIRVPKTIYLSSGITRRNYTYKDVAQLLGNEKFILKPSFGSKGKNIFLISNESEFKIALLDFKGICLFQEFIDTSKGKDFRSYVINGKYKGSAIRENENDFRTNFNLGARVLRLKEKNENLITLAQRTAETIGLWYCAVDILFDGTNYYVCEVNSVPGRTRKINTNRRLIRNLKLVLESIKE